VLSFHELPRDLAGESSAAQVSRPIYASAAGRWRNDLSADQVRAIGEVAGPLLSELGYWGGPSA
jgi:hypothetical protein